MKFVSYQPAPVLYSVPGRIKRTGGATGDSDRRFYRDDGAGRKKSEEGKAEEGKAEEGKAEEGKAEEEGELCNFFFCRCVCQ